MDDNKNRGIIMNIEEITMSDAKGKYKFIWKAFKSQFPSAKHEEIKKMISVVVAIQKGHVRDEELDE